jgi:RNA polymerase sigma factor (sigma-70 family)
VPIPADTFPGLLDRARQRDDRAAAQLVESFSPLLLAVIRRRLGLLKPLQRLHDPEDFAQEVWSAFFTRAIERNHFATPRDLTRFLVRAGRNRVLTLECRYLRCQKRALGRDVALEAPDGPGRREECLSTEPGPDRVAAGRDEWESILRDRSVVDRTVLILVGEGQTVAVVAEELRVSESTVKRIQCRARDSRRASPAEDDHRP